MHLALHGAVSLLIALSLLVPTPAAATEADEVPLPTVRWHRTPRLLNLQIVPGEGTHIAPDLPLRVSIFDGSVAVAERNGSVPSDEGSPAKLALPIFPKDAPDGWAVTLDGGVCSDGGARCQPFHVVAQVPRKGPARGTIETSSGRGPADVFETPSTPPRRPPDPVTQSHLRWFDASKSGDVEAAFADAARRETTVLADFFAVWCPPCDLLRDEVLHAPEYRELLKSYTLLRLDADAPESFGAKDRYAVGGYPTVLILAPDGELLDRIVGYPGAAQMARRLRRDTPIQSLPDLRASYDAAEEAEKDALGLVLAKRLVAVGDDDDAWAVLLASAGPPLSKDDDQFEGWPAEVIRWGTRLAVDVRAPEADQLVLLRAALPGTLDERALAVVAADQSLRSMDSPDPEAAADAFLKTHRDPLLADFRALVGATVTWGADGSGADVTRLVAGGAPQQWRILDAAYYLGTSSGLKDTQEGRDLLAIGASAATLGILQAAGKSPIGPPELELTIGLRPTIGPVTAEQMQLLRAHEGRYHELVSLLIAGGLVDVAEDYQRRLVATFPDTFTWHYRYAGFLRDHRSPSEALPSAELALKHAYGDNALRAALRTAEILLSLGRVDDSLAVIDAALGNLTPEEEGVRTHRYRSALQALRVQLVPSP